MRSFFLAGMIWVLNACSTLKETRALKAADKPFLSAPIVLDAFADSPLAGNFLTLRVNHTFTHTASGLFGYYSSGEWTSKGHLLFLTYHNSHGQKTHTASVQIDSSQMSLHFLPDSTGSHAHHRITYIK